MAMSENQKPLKVAVCIAPSWSLETPPLGLGILAAVARNENCEVQHYDLNLQSALMTKSQDPEKDFYDDFWSPGATAKWTNEEIFNRETLPKFKALLWSFAEKIAECDVVTFTALYCNILATDVLSQHVKSLNPQIKILYGGPYCWNGTNGGLKSNDFERTWVDLGCPMEGEGVFADALQAIQQGEPLSQVTGAWTWTDNQELHFNGARPAIRDLGSLPAANWDGVNLGAYADFHSQGQTHLPVQGSRGCTFKCTFCAETRVFRFKKGPDLKEEIVGLYNKYGIRQFTFVDSLINGSLIHFRRLVEALNEEIVQGRLPKLSISGYSRVHSDMDDDFMVMAGNVGYNNLSIGIETGSPKILELIEKGQTVEMAEAFLRSCHKGGVHPIANWITGYPRENQMDWLVSLDFLYRNRKYLPDVAANYRPAAVIPGTPLDVYRDKFDLLEKAHILYDFVSKNMRSTYINRNLRHRLTHLYLEIFNYHYSGSSDSRQYVKELEFKDRRSFDFNSDLFEKWDASFMGSFWTQEENEQKYPEIFEPRSLKLDVPYLEFANIPEERTWDGKQHPREIIKEQTRNEIRTWVWFIHQIAGPFKIKFELDDPMSERNFQGVRFQCKFEFESFLDGHYTLKIENQLTLEEQAQHTGVVYIPTPNPAREPGSMDYVDIQFEDFFEEMGQLELTYSEANHIKNTSKGVPNYVDTFDAEKYRIKLRRTELTGKF